MLKVQNYIAIASSRSVLLVLNAIQAGARAVVIVNSQDSHFRAESADGSTTLPTVAVPVVMIGKGGGDRVIGESDLFHQYSLTCSKLR